MLTGTWMPLCKSACASRRPKWKHFCPGDLRIKINLQHKQWRDRQTLKMCLFFTIHAVLVTHVILFSFKYMECNPCCSEFSGSFATDFNKDKIFSQGWCDFQPVFFPLIHVMTKFCASIPRMDQHPDVIKIAVVYHTYPVYCLKDHSGETFFTLCAINN